MKMKTLDDIRLTIRAMNVCIENIRTNTPVLVSVEQRRQIRASIIAIRNDCDAIRRTDLYHSLQFKEKFEVCFNLLQIIETLIELNRKYPDIPRPSHN